MSLCPVEQAELIRPMNVKRFMQYLIQKPKSDFRATNSDNEFARANKIISNEEKEINSIEKSRNDKEIMIVDDVSTWTTDMNATSSQAIEGKWVFYEGFFADAFADAARSSSSVLSVICNACIVPSGGVISSFNRSYTNRCLAGNF